MDQTGKATTSPVRFTLEVFQSSLARCTFRVVQGKQGYMRTGAFAQRKKGTYMLQSNTHANNFHIINDLSLPAFRAWHQLGITGLLIPEGCVDCWNGRLPLQSILLDMMNLTVVYPLENATSMDAPMCFDRLILQRFEEQPYYTRKGRFSRFWPRALFAGFCAHTHGYFRRALELEYEEVKRDASENSTDLNEARGNKTLMRQELLPVPGSSIDVAQTSNLSKPVLSWMS